MDKYIQCHCSLNVSDRIPFVNWYNKHESLRTRAHTQTKKTQNANLL